MERAKSRATVVTVIQRWRRSSPTTLPNQAERGLSVVATARMRSISTLISGTCTRAKSQLATSDTATTTNNGRIISATEDGESCKGRNESIAISVAARSAQRGFVAPSTAATRNGRPPKASVRVLSTTTMALSTSIPIAMIKPANEVRFIPSPRRSITTIVAAIESRSDTPTITP